MFKPNKILVPTDFSEYSDKALQKALDIAKEEGSEILLFHVIHDDFQTCVVDYCFTVDEIEAIKSRMFKGSQGLDGSTKWGSLSRDPKTSGRKRCRSHCHIFTWTVGYNNFSYGKCNKQGSEAGQVRGIACKMKPRASTPVKEGECYG
jgi:hypothetical protein